MLLHPLFGDVSYLVHTQFFENQASQLCQDRGVDWKYAWVTNPLVSGLSYKNVGTIMDELLHMSL